MCRAAVAAPLPLEKGAAPALQGMAACFLPLPVATGLPVHVNGYFELSSNRRDIWCGPTHLRVSRLQHRSEEGYHADECGVAGSAATWRAPASFGPTGMSASSRR